MGRRLAVPSPPLLRLPKYDMLSYIPGEESGGEIDRRGLMGLRLAVPSPPPVAFVLVGHVMLFAGGGIG